MFRAISERLAKLFGPSFPQEADRSTPACDPSFQVLNGPAEATAPSPIDDMIPDAVAANYVGGGGTEMFREIGDQLLGWLRLYADLKPTDRVLDVGCGIGRVAIPLTQFVQGVGRYDGFDIIPHGIEWCQKKITPRYPHFEFFHADIYNKYYNPNGKFLASEYTFPFEDETFDVVLLTSVFTHMLPADLGHYASEIGRVLKRGGRCFCTAFVVSAEGAQRLAENRSIRKFALQAEGYWTDNPGNPEAAIAYDDDHLEQVFRQSRLSLDRTVTGGWWDSPYAQDIIISTKRTTTRSD